MVASMDGVPFPVGAEDGQIEVKGKDPIRVTWHFPPVTNSSHTFILNYRALGVTRVDEKFDLLIWNAIPFEHDYPILSSTVQITFPRKSKVARDPEVNLENVRVKTLPSSFMFIARNLEKDAGLQVNLRFNRNSLISELPNWQRHQVETTHSINRVLPWTLGTFALLLLAGVAVIYLVWEQHANLDRGEADSQSPSPPPSVPPGNLPPAYPGVLNSTGAQPAWPHALAALLDLAQRGIVSIQEAGEKKILRQQDFSIQLLAPISELRSHERGLLNLLFNAQDGLQKNVKVSELGGLISGRFSQFAELLHAEMQADGLISERRIAIHHRWKIAGLIGLGLGLLVSIISFIAGGVSNQLENWTVMSIAAFTLSIGLAGILTGLATVIVAGFYTPLTEKGVKEAGHWRAYAEYLREVTREREPITRPDLFETALPYAASFGFGEAWAKFFQKHGENQVPAWFQTLSQKDAEATDMAAFVAMISASNGVVSDGGSAGAAGGVGAAGGGASGAG
jgi:hypothetical protein